MFPFIFRRLLLFIPVLWDIATITFFMVRLAPGDPFSDEKEMPEEVRARIKAQYGLDQPLHIQYGRYLLNLLRGDLGPSYKHIGTSVNTIIKEAFPKSLELGLYAMAIALILGVTAGSLAALKQNSILDYAPMSLAMVGICLPTFVMGPLLVLVFGLWLEWFPVAGWSTWFGEGFFPENWPQDRVLPACTLGFFYAAMIARLTRGGMLETLSQDFIKTARAKGLTETRVVLKHGLRGGILPTVSFLGPAFAGIISGSFVIETIFNIPGLGRHFIEAATNRDYTLVLGTVLFYATLILMLNLLVDIMQAWLNPRIRIQ